MEPVAAASPSVEPLHSPTVALAPTQNGHPPAPSAADFGPEPGIPSPSKSTVNSGKSITVNKKKMKMMKKKKKKKVPVDVLDEPSSSTSSSCSATHCAQRGVRLASRQRNPRVSIGCSARQKEADVDALALTLGMSIAAVVAQVLERKDAGGQTIYLDHLSQIYALAVKESLANVFGDRFDSFARNFEKSFRSTLMTLRLINESSQHTGEHSGYVNKRTNYLDATPGASVNKEHGFTCGSGLEEGCQSEMVQHTISSEEHFNILEETEQNTPPDSINRELILHGVLNRQLDCVSPRMEYSVISQSMHGALEKSVIEQTRSNDLKEFEIGLIVKRLELKEKQLALSSHSNFIERCKLSMGISKASFKEEKFKSELEETRHAELLRKCVDCLVGGLLIMLASLAYGTYVYSYSRIIEATASCTPSQVSKSWWLPKPMASVNSGLQILWCLVQVVSRMIFGMLMILAIVYLLLIRSSASAQRMPVTFIILLGFACGWAGRFCVDTLGGRGSHWLGYWAVLCLLHFLSNICTSTLFLILYGPVTVPGGETYRKTIFPHWIRRSMFYATILLFLPLMCGLMPFASPAEWKDHFASRAMDFFQATSD
ncbi:protein CPR-5 isoform X2 [Diospyros lotus]|uniref:protein CPR-5 isoform X2 n=1 Tax=Diospyros lotus TaxID=55363 RepID=UPI00224EAF8F|nr:protein CPR-5 isoform X2 [Diospyros lotus]